MLGGMDAQIQQYQEEKAVKEGYIRDYIENYGYNLEDFNSYLEWQRGKYAPQLRGCALDDGKNIDNWSVDDLGQCIRDYYAYVEQNQGGGEAQHTQEEEPKVVPKVDEKDLETKIAQMNLDMKDADKDLKVNDSKVATSEIQPQAKQPISEADYEDLIAPNIPEKRMFANTKKFEPTVLNGKRIQVRVSDGQMKSGGLFSSSYLLFKVRTEPLGWTILRKDQDFYFLRKILLKNFPYIIIPPLPLKKKKDSEKSLKRRERYFTRFLQAVCRNEELKSSPFLVEWLDNEEPKQFAAIMKSQEKAKVPKSLLEAVVTQRGSVPVHSISNSQVFCGKMTEFIDSYQILYNEVIECAKDINEKSQALASTMFAMHKYVEQLSELNRMTRCSDQHEMYAWLSKMVTGTGNFIAQQGDLFKNFLGSHLKYHLSEHDTFREILKQRDEVNAMVTRHTKQLNDKKEKMLRNKDITKWGYNGNVADIEKHYDQLIENKEAAFTYMLQKETKENAALQEELAFISNQCLSETRRVGKDNGKLLIDHFIQMSQTQCSYINQTHVMWADFLSHFQEEQEAHLEEEQQYEAPQQPVMDEPVEEAKQGFTGESGGTNRVDNDEDDYRPVQQKQEEEPEMDNILGGKKKKKKLAALLEDD